MPQPFLLTAFEFNNSNARSRRKGRLYFLSAVTTCAAMRLRDARWPALGTQAVRLTAAQVLLGRDGNARLARMASS